MNDFFRILMVAKSPGSYFLQNLNYHMVPIFSLVNAFYLTLM